ncbi:MAG TPA: IPT/TIG domain-containing protein [Balneolaceae bacterium]|nr:IPT/TIG domain-containing protein [Balneolaceae bacterium]
MKKLLPILSLFIMSSLLISCGNDNATPKPEISGIQPDHGPSGTTVTISGQGFQPHASAHSVNFGGVAGDVFSVTKDQMQVGVPDGAKSGAVEVSVADQVVSGPHFTVEAKAPGISSVNPDSGVVGTEVTIKGMNFSSSVSDIDIAFNGTDAPVNGAAEDQLKTEVPQGATDGPIKVTVKQKSAESSDFDVITDGTLKLTTTTSGSDKDADGYSFSVDGNSTQSVGNSETVVVSDLEKGSHDVELSGMADNCSVSGQNPRSISITAGDTTSTTFDVSCQDVAKNQIVFTSDRGGNSNIYLMNADGSNPKKLTDNTAGLGDGYAVISPDGTQIAFFSDGNSKQGLYLMDVDGSNVKTITTGKLSYPYIISWSPDGRKIAYCNNADGDSELYTINIDGTDKQKLTDNSSADYAPTWSPDGKKIAYIDDKDGDFEIFIMNADGTGNTKVTDNSDRDAYPRWSPDGSKLTYVNDSEGNNEIYTINTEGTGIRRVTNNSANDSFPAWSPDGSELVFQSDRSGNGEVYKINADGSGSPVNLTANSAGDGIPFWSPVK